MNEENSNKINFNIFLHLILPISIGIICGIAVQTLWQNLNSIKTEKIYLMDMSRQYVDSREAGVKILPNTSIEIKLSWLKRGILRLGVCNQNIKTFKNGSLHLTFPKEIQVIGGYDWRWTNVSTALR